MSTTSRYVVEPGAVIGLLTVLADEGLRDGYRRHRCRCRCGRVMTIRSKKLRRGEILSCHTCRRRGET